MLRWHCCSTVVNEWPDDKLNGLGAQELYQVLACLPNAASWPCGISYALSAQDSCLV